MIIKKGSTDVTTYFKLIDPTTGAPETGLTITDLDASYVRDGAAAVKADLTALAAVDSAHGDNKGYEVDGTNCPGLYRVDWPDAAFATGVNRVQLCVNGVAVDPAYMEIELVNYDPADGVRLGLTALPNAAADGVGGLPISDAGGLDLDAKLANTNEITAARMGALTDWINGGRLDLIIDAILLDTGTTLDGNITAIKTKTDYLPSVVAGGAGGLFIAGANAATSVTTAFTANITGNLSGSVGSVTGNIGGNVAGSVASIAAGGITSGSFALGAISSTTFAAGAITANAIAADAIGASELAADAASKIGTAVWATAARTLTDKAGFSLAADQSGVTIGTVTLVTTCTTNTDMRGTDNAALAATALSNETWTDAKAGYLDTDLSTLDGKLDTIGGIVDAILVDTGTTLDGYLSALYGMTEEVA